MTVAHTASARAMMRNTVAQPQAVDIASPAPAGVNAQVEDAVRARVIDLSFFYGEKQALINVNFPVHDRNHRAVRLRQKYASARNQPDARPVSWQSLPGPGDPLP